MSAKTTVGKAVQSVAEAHTNLTVFAAVVSLMEGGHLYGYCAAADRIIKIAQQEQHRQLRLYDAAVAKVASLTP